MRHFLATFGSPEPLKSFRSFIFNNILILTFIHGIFFVNFMLKL